MRAFRPDFTGARLRPSPNFGERAAGRQPDILILHYTGMESGQKAEDWLADPQSEVSSHYLIHEDGETVQMVREIDRAWHAGKSFWAGETDINSASIGIEIVNPGHAHGYPEFPHRQIESVIALCLDIGRRHAIRPERVLAHSDVSPGRKIDPGEKFPWRRLFQSGVGHFADLTGLKDDEPPNRIGTAVRDVAALQAMLARYGYRIDVTGRLDQSTETVVAAFQRHFRPERVDGMADPHTLATLAGLIAGLEPRERA